MIIKYISIGNEFKIHTIDIFYIIEKSIIEKI